MERAGHLIGKLKKTRDLADPQARACKAWPVAAGAKIARHTRATLLVRNALVVEVEDVIWQRNLWGFRKDLLENLEAILGEPLVASLDFRPMPAKRMPQRAESARPPAEQIEDPVLDMLYRKSRKGA